MSGRKLRCYIKRKICSLDIEGRRVIYDYVQDIQLLWNLSCLKRLQMHSRNQSQMIIHKLKLKPLFTPNIKCNIWYAMVLSSSDECRSSLWSRVSTLFSSGAVGFNGVRAWGSQRSSLGKWQLLVIAVSHSNRLWPMFNVQVLWNNCSSSNFCYYHLGSTHLACLVQIIDSLFRLSCLGSPLCPRY